MRGPICALFIEGSHVDVEENWIVKTKSLLVGVLVVFSLVFAVGGCSGKTAESNLAGPSRNANLSIEDQVFNAAAEGDVAKLKSLLDQDKTLVDAYGQNGISPLHSAAMNGQNGAVKLLLEYGADPMVENDDGNNAINSANVEGHPDTAKILVDAAGAKPAQ